MCALLLDLQANHCTQLVLRLHGNGVESIFCIILLDTHQASITQQRAAGSEVVLFVIGTRWLVATPDFAGLILNALALGFIIGARSLLLRCSRTKNSGRLMANRERKSESDAHRGAVDVYICVMI